MGGLPFEDRVADHLRDSWNNSIPKGA